MSTRSAVDGMIARAHIGTVFRSGDHGDLPRYIAVGWRLAQQTKPYYYGLLCQCGLDVVAERKNLLVGPADKKSMETLVIT